MEIGEILRPGFLDLLKKNGTIIINTFSLLPMNTKKEDYPHFDKIEKLLKNYTVITVNANDIVYEMGDIFGKSANVLVLGILSRLKPFDSIPEKIWIDALSAISHNENINSLNVLAFDKGRKYLSDFNKNSLNNL